MSDELEVLQAQPLALRHELSVEEVVARVNKVHDVMKRAMQDGHHYGVIPGTPKPTLLKPGAELLCVMFRLDPQPATTVQREGGHLTVVSTTTLYHIPTGQRWGSGMGSCSTKESRYAFRTESQKCPKCGQATIIKGKAEYGGGWLCFKKKGGCGEKFKDDDTAITGQTTGRIANEDLADQENTVLKMANKRSLVAAVLNVTAASDIFTQDLEDTPHDTVTVAASGVRSVMAGDNEMVLPSEIVGQMAERETMIQGGSVSLPHPGLKKAAVAVIVAPSHLHDRAAAETTEQQAARLFPTEEEQEMRVELVRQIRALAGAKKVSTKDRQLLAGQYLNGAELDVADVACLQDLRGALEAL